MNTLELTDMQMARIMGGQISNGTSHPPPTSDDLGAWEEYLKDLIGDSAQIISKETTVTGSASAGVSTSNKPEASAKIELTMTGTGMWSLFVMVGASLDLGVVYTIQALSNADLQPTAYPMM